MKNLELKKNVITEISDLEMAEIKGGGGSDTVCPTRAAVPECQTSGCPTKIRCGGGGDDGSGGDGGGDGGGGDNPGGAGGF